MAPNVCFHDATFKYYSKVQKSFSMRSKFFIQHEIIDIVNKWRYGRTYGPIPRRIGRDTWWDHNHRIVSMCLAFRMSPRTDAWVSLDWEERVIVRTRHNIRASASVDHWSLYSMFLLCSWQKRPDQRYSIYVHLNVVIFLCSSLHWCYDDDVPTLD